MSTAMLTSLMFGLPKNNLAGLVSFRFLSEMDVVRLVLLDQFRRHQTFAGAPDEIHFGVRGAERQTRFENQQHAAVKEKQRANQSQHHRDKGPSRAEKRHDTDGHAGGHEDADREIESCQRSLQQT